MAETVNVPGIGPVKKSWAVGGVAVIAGILAVAYYRHSKNASAAAVATDTSQDPNAIDPATGLTYGEEAAGIQAGDLAGGGSAFGDTSGIIGYGANGQPIYSDQVGYGPTPVFINNAAWAQAAQQYLVSSTGADAGTVAAALGTYLNGQPLTQAQASVVQQAIAFFGQPPQAGSNGYPPSLNLQAPSGSGTPPPPPGGGGGDGGGSNPPPEPPPAGGGPITVAPSGFRIAAVNGLAITLAWDPIQVPAGEGPLRSYIVAYGQSPDNMPYQRPVVRSATSTTIRFNSGPGAHGLRHYFILWADPASPNGPHAGPISAQTQ